MFEDKDMLEIEDENFEDNDSFEEEGLEEDIASDSFEDDSFGEEELEGPIKKSKKLTAEYDDAYDGEEKMMHKLANIRSSIKKIEKDIPVDSIIITNFKKSGRMESITGLTGVVSEWGVVSPIHVLAMEDDDVYQLLDGLRRVYAAVRAGQKTVRAIVWIFTDRREGKELANILSLMINRNQKYTPKEMWEQMKVLEQVNDATPGLIEYLLQMNSGEAMKLKDVMLSDYDEFKDDLLIGKYTIEQAYKKLCNARKKEDKLEKEDKISVDGEGMKDANTRSFDDEATDDEVERLSSEEAKELLEMQDLDRDVDDDDIDSLDMTNDIRKDNMYQKVGERTFVDESVKKATLIRDKNKCRCCGIGGPQWAGILVYHHVIPVYAGGPDTVENGLTLCVNCHLTLHNYITGDVQVPKDLEPDQEKIFKNIMKFGNVAIEASNKLGMKRDALRKANAKSKKHPMPNANVKLNKEALAEAGLDEEEDFEEDIEETFDIEEDVDLEDLN